MDQNPLDNGLFFKNVTAIDCHIITIHIKIICLRLMIRHIGLKFHK